MSIVPGWLKTVAIIVCFSIPATAWAADGSGDIEVELRYEAASASDPGYHPLYGGFSTIQEGTDCKLPAPDLPCFAFELGGKKHNFAFGKASWWSGAYSRLYIDKNGNGDLTDDGFIDGTALGLFSGDVFFGFIDLSYEVDGKTLPYTVEIRVSKGFGRRPRISVDARCIWTGDFTIDGRARTISLGDAGGGGFFNKTARLDEGISRGEDVIFMGSRFMVHPAGAGPQYHDRLELTSFLGFGDKLYRLTIDLPNKKLTLDAPDVPLVPLKIPPSLRHLQMISNDMATSLTFYDPPPVVRVPQGEYRLIGYSAYSLKPERESWILFAHSAKSTPGVSVVPGATGAEWAIGEPYSPAITSRTYARNWFGGRGHRLDFGLKGRGGERVTSVIWREGRQQMALPTPRYQIVTADGEIVAGGRFEYG